MDAGAPPTDCSIATIGTYDGVHLGHRRLIEETCAVASTRPGCRSVVVTFDAHPSTVLRPETPVPMLCTLEEKLALLESTGIDEVCVLEFDGARARETAEEFVVRDLVERLGVTRVVVGTNFRFGHERRGDLALLERLGDRYGFVATGIELVLDDEHHSVVSSTRIRHLLRRGDLSEAARLLGHPYVLPGAMGSDGHLVVPRELLVPPAGHYDVGVIDREPGGPFPAPEVRATVTIADGIVVADPDDVSAHLRKNLVSLVFDRDPESASHLGG